jgi:hypothetical protein
MKKFITSTRSNVFSNNKSLARYLNIDTEPSSFRKPMHPLDNLDPGRRDYDMIDEYDKSNILTLGFQENFNQDPWLQMHGELEENFLITTDLTF